jgi:hypothetical protein
MGVLAQFGMNTDTTATPAAAVEAYEFLSESLTTAREVVRTEGLRGTRLHPVERIRQGRQTPGGTVTLQPTYAELVNLLPRVVGANSSGTYTVSDTVPVAFQTVIDRVAKVYTYTGCRVGKATFKCGVGQPLELALEIEALTESVANAGTFASLTVSATPPFVWTDGTLTLAGNAVQVMEFETTLDWHLKPDRFVNSLTRTDLPSMDLTVSTKFVVPYTSDTTGLYDGGGGVAGVTGNINFTYLGAGGGAAGVNVKLTYGNLVFPAEKSPAVGSKDEITLLLQGEARKTGSTAPLVVALDSTP